MNYMFSRAALFNIDISNWDVSSVTDMERMFFQASSFTQKLCGDAWVNSKASKSNIFAGSARSMSTMACATTAAFFPQSTKKKRQHVTRHPIPERELIVRTPITTSASTLSFTSKILRKMACPKCGTFAKSGRVSCCAPGGAWYKNCGGAANKNLDHRWSEGVEACKRKSEADAMLYSPIDQ